MSKSESAEIRNKASKISTESIQATVAKAQQDTIKTLSLVQEQSITALNDLDSIKKAIEVERQEQERIHSVAAIALTKEEAEQQLADRKNEIDRELASYQQQVDDKKAEADRTHNETVRANAERNQREQAQWSYEFEAKKRGEQAAWDETKRRRDLDEQIRAEGFERNFKEREAALSARETELAELRQKVSNFPAELDKAVKKETAIVTSSLTRDNNHAIEILNSKQAAEKLVLDNTVASLKGENANKDRIIEQLQVKLNAAEERVSTIATRALDTAANVKAQADANTSAAIAANNGSKRA